MKNYLLIIMCLLMLNVVSAQEKQIKGVVKNKSGQLLEGASVSIKGESTKTTTDSEGRFIITAKENAVLVVMYLDLTPEEVVVASLTTFSVNDNNEVVIQLGVKDDIFDMSLEELMNVEVISVSKKKERVLEAPATVVVITGEDIKRRGYSNIEEVFHDLPGFDISRGNGNDYTTIYQRGYRSPNIDRTLILIDGVEDNDIWKGNIWLSRQYSLSNIERIEVIYGPASTMYGANAFLGTINIITKNPEDFIKGDNKVGVSGSVGYGSWNTAYGDITIAAKFKRDVSFSLTSRYFYSDEMDLSGYPDFDYNLDNGEVFNYDNAFYTSKLKLSKSKYPKEFAALLGNSQHLGTTYTLSVSSNGDSVLIPTAEAISLAKQLDKSGLDTVLRGEKVRFSDITKDWMVDAKLKIGNFTYGFQTWQRYEGNNTWYTEWFFPGGKQDRTWVPEHTVFYTRYDKLISEKLTLNVSANFVTHTLNEQYSRDIGYYSYARGKLKLNDLIKNTESYFLTNYYYVVSNQFRTEAKVIYQPTKKLNIVSGIEYRTGLIQGDYVTAKEDEHPSENGSMRTYFKEGNHFFSRDIGYYLQTTYKPFEILAVTLGGRIDNNKVKANGGYGSEFNPRVALVCTPANFIFKAIYAEAFKDADYWQKYSTADQRKLNNPTLKPERVKNIELSAGWQVTDNLFADAVGYNAQYTGAVGTVVVPYENTTTTQHQPVGEYTINGGQARISYKIANYLFTTNYTYTDAKNIKTETGEDVDKPIGDIANHHINFIAGATYFKKLDVSLRANYVGERITGKNTTVKDNPLDKIAPYTILSSTVTYRGAFVKGLDFQLYLNNLLNTKYYHPGLRAADGFEYAAQIPQNEFNFMLKALFSF